MKKKKNLGPGFLDELFKVTASSTNYKSQKEGEWRDLLLPNYEPHLDRTIGAWRPTLLFCLAAILFFAVLLRLFHLQIVKGSENRQLAEGNRIQIKKIHAPRGVIYDRNGQILAQNKPGFRLIEKRSDGSFKITQITRDEAINMEVSGDPKFSELEVDNIRDYPFGEQTAHILGYVGQVSPEELKEPRFSNYNSGDKVGREGVEETYEKTLKEIDGGEVIEVDSSGRKIRTLRTIDPIPGKSLSLSIDINLQKKAYENLKKALILSGSCCGTVIVEDVGNGAILSLVNLPSFDPDQVELFLTAPHSPMLNRAISGTYPPGSIFKIVSSLAGLSSGKISSQTHFEDTGVLALGPYTFANWYFTEYGKTEGSLDIVRAIQRSNDIFFYRVGQEIGEEEIAKMARKLGFGKLLGIDIPGEGVGIVPDNKWKLENYNEVWFPGDTLHMAIGQGFVTVTPLEVSNLISTVAAGGKIYSPHLELKKQISESKFNFKKEDLNLVKSGLALVPKNGGTAWPFFTFPIPTAGKTGTAEFGDPRSRTHAWYTSYAPADDPKIAVTVLVEAGGEGSTIASPVAKEIYRWYFSPDKNNLIKDSYEEATPAARTLGE